MMKRTLTTLAVAIVAVLTTATTAFADYPPSPAVMGNTVQTVAPQSGTAFTGAGDTLLWITAFAVLLAIGAGLIYWSKSPERT
jgi:hypothetical protein